MNTPWTVESLAEAATGLGPHSQSVLKELIGQTPLQYVTEWRMQKAKCNYSSSVMKKLIDVARLVGYESDAAACRDRQPSFTHGRSAS